MNFAIIDGKETLYTSCSETMDHGTAWDDMQYLGRGDFSHSRGFW